MMRPEQIDKIKFELDQIVYHKSIIGKDFPDKSWGRDATKIANLLYYTLEYITTLESELARLRKLVEEAPHEPECMLLDWSIETRRCNCWKRNALGEVNNE